MEEGALKKAVAQLLDRWGLPFSTHATSTGLGQTVQVRADAKEEGNISVLYIRQGNGGPSFKRA